MLGWRDVPTDPDRPRPDRPRGDAARSGSCSSRGADGEAGLDLERRAFALRKVAERRARETRARAVLPVAVVRARWSTRACSPPTSSATFFPDLTDERFASAIGLVHSRFSTNTFPSWPLAHPFRYIAHNGEINTIRGNRNWMRTREALLESDLIPGDLQRLFPICTPDASATRPPSTRCSSCCTSAAAACRTRC